MNKLLLLFLLLAGASNTYAQSAEIRTATDTISIRKHRFYQGDKRLNQQQLTRVMKQQPDAWKVFKSARANNNVAFALGFAGGFMVGWTVGTAIAGGDPVWEVAGAGAGLIVASIPFSVKSGRQMKKAADTYNAGLQVQASRYRPGLSGSVSANRIGLTLHF